MKNHLTKEVNSNMSLMFYNFNDYGNNQPNQATVQMTGSFMNNQPAGDRVPSR